MSLRALRQAQCKLREAVPSPTGRHLRRHAVQVLLRRDLDATHLDPPRNDMKHIGENQLYE